MTTTARYWIVAIIILALVIGGAWYLKSKGNSVPAAPAAQNQQASGVPATPVQAFALTVQKRKVVSGATTLTVKQGDTVTITITADESDELHLHGYDKSVEFATNTPAMLTLVADKSGRFPFEMEGSKTDLGELDVQP